MGCWIKGHANEVLVIHQNYHLEQCRKQKHTNEVANLTKEISKQNIRSANWCPLAAYNKILVAKNELETKLFSFSAEFRENIKEPGLPGFKNKTVSHFHSVSANNFKGMSFRQRSNPGIAYTLCSNIRMNVNDFGRALSLLHQQNTVELTLYQSTDPALSDRYLPDCSLILERLS